MRERLVLGFVGMTLAVIGLYGVPRAYFLADLVREDTAQSLAGSATVLTALVAEREARGLAVDGDLLRPGLGPAERITFTEPGRAEISVGGAVDPEGAIVERRRLSDGSTLTLSVSRDEVSRAVLGAVTPLLLLGVSLAALSAVLGFALARRMSRPFQELADAARSLGHGRFDIDVPSYAVPEAAAIATALRGAGTQLDQLVRREREFAVNASHQLRTPITALRLNLEDIALWPETPPSVRDELESSLGELDRLNAAIGELLDLARGRRLESQGEVDLAAVVGSAARRWEPRLDQEGRGLVVRAPGVVRAQLAAGPIEQILDVLIENARLHGTGEIVVETRDAGSHLEVTVSDDGDGGALDGDIFHRGVTTRRTTDDGHGIGLAVAAELAEVSGGHLSLDRTAPTTRFVLWLPVARLS